MEFRELVAVSEAVGATRSRLKKVEHLAGLLRRVSTEALPVAVAFLAGEMRQGKIGLGGAAIRQALAALAPAEESPGPPVTIAEVDQVLAEIAEVSGTGAAQRRQDLLVGLFTRLSAAEVDFLARLIVGNLRHGALEGVLVEAVAAATDTPPPLVRRAVMLTGDLPEAAQTAKQHGSDALGQYTLELFRPVQPMLAETAEDPAEALQVLGEAVLEYKLDGVRLQIHKDGSEVRVYTRHLNDITENVPEIVEQIGQLGTGQVVLDGEALALRPDGRPHAFQVTMKRFGRRKDVDALRQSHPLSLALFDCLRIDQQVLIDEPTSDRHDALASAVDPKLRVPQFPTQDEAAADAFLEQALAAGHEGIMAKSRQAAYEAGGRGKSWLKIKPAHTLDLAILAAEWGSGRRRGTLSNLHLGARDEETGGFAMIGKTFKGLTDAMLAEQTEALLALETGRDDQTVHVAPRLVVEVAFNEVQQSPHYPSGFALRFARVKRFRFDKPASHCDTLETIERIYQSGRA